MKVNTKMTTSAVIARLQRQGGHDSRQISQVDCSYAQGLRDHLDPKALRLSATLA